jgi:sulfite reductase (NADPH) flavoprotein alpha-component
MGLLLFALTGIILDHVRRDVAAAVGDQCRRRRSVGHGGCGGLQRLPPARTGRAGGLDEKAVAAALQLLPRREYSIASLPVDGAIHLLVRQMRGRGGYLGLGSGWLTALAPVGAEIALRVCSNVNFHASRDARPLILIGNGTGLAALRALLKTRIAAGHGATGCCSTSGMRRTISSIATRSRAGWREARSSVPISPGRATRPNASAYSRGCAKRQTNCSAGSAPARRFCVCGSLDGLAPGVDAVLREVLGAAQIEQLRGQGRYRRDVY